MMAVRIIRWVISYAAGNLIQRVFICNITPNVIGRVIGDETRVVDEGSTETSKSSKKEKLEDLIKVNAIMPNPTTGIYGAFISPLDNGNVLLLDVNGKVLEKRRQSGNNLAFDISDHPSGMYFIRVEVQGKVYTFKVAKQ
jgi:hypothetical protein